MTLTVPLLPDLAVVPIFQYIKYEDLPESEKAGHAVYKTIAAVRVQYSGNNGRSYSPVFPADAISHREGHRSVTYAERWADQYAAFISGNTQSANGTPLENLRPFGISEAMLSMARAIRVYTIESLLQLDGGTGKSLGMFSNDMMEMARKWAATKDAVGASAAEIEDLKAQIEALKAAQAAQSIDDGHSDAEVEALKARYADLKGSRPRGNPTIENLRKMVQIAEEEAGQ